MKDKKIEFLYQSISDTQNTIRAIDMKLGFLFVVVFMPVVSIPDVYEVYQKINVVIVYKVLSYALIVTWCMSFFLLYRAVVSIKNPQSVIENFCGGDSCSFYNGDLFSFKTVDVFFNFPINANKTIGQKCSMLPNTQDEVIVALVAENIKLAYIRDLKIKRSTWCIVFTFLFVSMGTFIWSLSAFKVFI